MRSRSLAGTASRVGLDHVETRYTKFAAEFRHRPEVGNVDALAEATGSLGGLLSWYSLIHHDPRTIQIPPV